MYNKLFIYFKYLICILPNSNQISLNSTHRGFGIQTSATSRLPPGPPRSRLWLISEGKEYKSHISRPFHFSDLPSKTNIQILYHHVYEGYLLDLPWVSTISLFKAASNHYYRQGHLVGLWKPYPFSHGFNSRRRLVCLHTSSWEGWEEVPSQGGEGRLTTRLCDLLAWGSESRMFFDRKSVLRELLSGNPGGSVEHSAGRGLGSGGVNRVLGTNVGFYHVNWSRYITTV